MRTRLIFLDGHAVVRWGNKKMEWYQNHIEQIEKTLQVNSNNGLLHDQVKLRRKKFGKNQIEEEKKVSRVFLFMAQFQDVMVLILFAAALIAGLLGEMIDATAIMVIVILNGCIGFFQEQKAEKSLEKLKQLAAPAAYVLREKEWIKIDASDIVVGDVIRLRPGDRIPADVRLIRTKGIETEESAITGESVPVVKHATAIHAHNIEPQDQANMAFKGTLVTRGSGEAIVVAIGMETMMGQIATLMTTTKKVATPLERRLGELGKVLIVAVLMLTALVIGVGILQGNPAYDMFLAGVSLAVAAIPEGLPAIVTVALSLGVQRMIRKKAVIRKLSAVETLGCASVICSDKTGTITENMMTVQQLYVNGSLIEVGGAGNDPEGTFYYQEQMINRTFPSLENLLLYSMICNDASLGIKKGKYIIDGDPTDGALLIAARKLGLTEAEEKQYTIIKEFPFDSLRKRMSVIVEDMHKRRFLITKGAPEILIPRSTYQLKDTLSNELTDASMINDEVENMAKQALRTLAICIKPLQKDMLLDDPMIEQDLTFVGLVGMIDPPRKEVAPAIKQCKEAGIKTVMITGDHVTTAKAISRQIGLLDENSRVIEGREIEQMNQEQLTDQIEDIAVFARVSPAHKLRIVEAFQAQGHIVAMTGDGINDAPAIKASDIGISMGQTGTDVTREASSLILMDDNFTTIKDAIREGRNIYENIRKFIRYLLASNVGEILVMLFAILLGYPLPLIPVQILWVNLVTDGLPAMALGLDKPEKNVMSKKPRDAKERIFAHGLGFKIISRGILIGVVSLIAFISTYKLTNGDLDMSRTHAFTTLVMAQLIHVFDCRAEKSIFSRNPFGNLYLIGAVISSFLLLVVVIYTPSLQAIFQTVALDWMDWMFITTLSIIPTIFFGLSKR